MSDNTPRLRIPELVSMQEANCVTWNEALLQLDAFVDLYLLGQFVDTPPSSPADGDAYLIGGAPTGAWSGYAYKIASCLDGAWRFCTPFNGLRACVAETGRFIFYKDGAWIDALSLPGGGIIDGSGRLGIGTASPAGNMEITSANGNVAAYIAAYGSNPAFIMRTAGGTSASPSAVTSGNSLGAIVFQGHNGSAFTTRKAGVVSYAAENWSGTANGTYLTFETTPLGSTTNAEHARLDPSGCLLVGYTASNGAYPLQVNGQIFATSATIATSDLTLKRLAPISDKLLDDVSAIPIILYTRTDRPQDGMRAGYGAQHWRKVLTDNGAASGIVRELEDGVLALDESAASALKIAALEAALRRLEKRLVALENLGAIHRLISRWIGTKTQ